MNLKQASLVYKNKLWIIMEIVTWTCYF